MPTVTPTVITDLLANPGIGYQSSWQTDNQNPNYGDFPFGSYYKRYYWAALEPTAGNYNLSSMVSDYNAARARGQYYSFRINSADDDGTGPAWLRSMGVAGYAVNAYGSNFWIPYFGDATVKARGQALFEAIADQFSGNPYIDFIDIGFIGAIGEWHFYQYYITALENGAPGVVGQQVPMPALVDAKWWIDMIMGCFPGINTLAINGEPTPSTATDMVQYAIGQGAGWRGDSLGDSYHMTSRYYQALPGGVDDVTWQTALVAFETAPPFSSQNSTALTASVDFALGAHASIVENRQDALISWQLSEIQRMILGLGYRLELTSITYPTSVAPGDQLSTSTTWNNSGVAPPYVAYEIAFRLYSGSTPVFTASSGISVAGWLPGSRTVTPEVTLSGGIDEGTYTLAVGVVSPGTTTPAINLAIDGKDAAGWYPLGTITVELASNGATSAVCSSSLSLSDVSADLASESAPGSFDMRLIRQSTAVSLVFGPFVSKDDAVTALTAVAAPTAGRIIKNGTGAALDMTAGGRNWTHDASGHYVADLLAGDVDTIGRLRIHFDDAATYLPVWEDYYVVSQAFFDWFTGTASPLSVGTGTGQINPSSGKVAATLAAADVTGNVAADLQTIKTQAITCSAGVTVNPNVGTATAALVVDASGRVQVQSGTGAGQVSISSGKVAATLAAADVTGNVASDVQTIKTQAITCGAGVTVNPNVGTATAALVVDASGRVQLQYGTGAGQVNLTGGNLAGAVPSVTNDVGITQGGADKVWGTTARTLTAAGLDSVVIETDVNARQALSVITAALAGTLSGAGTGAIVIRGADVETTRIEATTDQYGNRSLVTLTLPT